MADLPHPIEWQFHRFWFLFWQLIFGRPGVADLPHVELQFHRFWFLFWQLIFGRPGVADLPPPNRMAISQILIPILTAHIWQTRCGRSTPCHKNGNFTDFDSYSNSFIFGWPGVADLPPPIEWQFHRFWFLFWQLIFGRSGVADLPHAIEWQFHRFWFLFWQLIFGRPGVADLPPVEQQFHRFWFLFWQLIFGRPGVADLPPCHRMAISQILIPILTAHIWLTRCGRSTPTQ